jgi:hypothetical protein
MCEHCGDPHGSGAVTRRCDSSAPRDVLAPHMGRGIFVGMCSLDSPSERDARLRLVADWSLDELGHESSVRTLRAVRNHIGTKAHV